MTDQTRYQCAACGAYSLTPSDALAHAAIAGHRRIVPFTARMPVPPYARRFDATGPIVAVKVYQPRMRED